MAKPWRIRVIPSSVVYEDHMEAVALSVIQGQAVRKSWRIECIVWKTPKSYAGQCRTMRLTLADQVGGPATWTANFQFKK